MWYILLGGIILVLIIILFKENREKKNIKNKLNTNNKHWECYVIMKKWMENRNSNKTLKKYFSNYPYNKIAVYGAGDLGKLFAFEMRESDITISYFIDRSAEGNNSYDGIPIVTIEDFEKQEKVDAIIVTPIVDYNSVCEELVRKGINTATVSLRDIIYEV